MKKKVFSTAIITLMIAFFISGCMEPRYYRENHRHSDGYNHRHHRTTEGGVEVRIHN